ncbi:MAG: hypothetical protein C0444_01725 [Microbacterium sp.]|nr:hypothetical protein [Microbacterium sp.]MBA4346538.1 hypothetical protein [Microbacterium sp.]
MLFDATAVLIASLTVATVTGPYVVLENSVVHPPAVGVASVHVREIGLPGAGDVALVPSIPSIPGSGVPAFVLPTLTDRTSAAPLAAPLTAAPAPTSPLGELSGSALLTALAAHPAAFVNEVVASQPGGLHALVESLPGAPQVRGWWTGLDSATQRTIMLAAPEVIGNLDGIPVAVRNDANRHVLRSTIRELELADGSVGRSIEIHNQHRLQMLYAVADALGPVTANPPRTLLQLDTYDQGTVAIAFGDLETADYVSYLMPGMFITVGGNVVEWADTAARLYDEQVSWLSLLAEVGASDEVETVATVAWIGYQTPHLLNVGSLDLAYEGRDAIASAIDGLQTIRGSDQPFIALLAHSYGSTAAMLALEESTTVDALAIIGSPGAPASTVDDLNVRGDVFVGEAAWDPIPNSSFFGSDPGSAEFGARVMSVAGVVDVITNRVLAASVGHNEYFSPGTESMRNLALIGIDKGELVTDGSQRDAGRTLALLL